MPDATLRWLEEKRKEVKRCVKKFGIEKTRSWDQSRFIAIIDSRDEFIKVLRANERMCARENRELHRRLKGKK